MATLKLPTETDYDFILIGVSSNMPDYRICWAINNALFLQLEKVDDYELFDKQKKFLLPICSKKITSLLFRIIWKKTKRLFVPTTYSQI